MTRLQSVVPLLRPLATPRAVACCHHFRFSTVTSRQSREFPPNVNSVKQSSLPPNASPRQPRTPREAQRAADLAAAESLTEGDSAQSPEQKHILPSKHPRADNKPNKRSSQDKPAQADNVTPRPLDAFDKVADTTQQRKKSLPKRQNISQTSELVLPPPAYHISRSINKHLPVYTDTKRGGNLRLTIIRKVAGDLVALRDEVKDFLGNKGEEVTINHLTSHVQIKGHCKREVEEFLTARGF
ncbi:Img2 domain containing protein [Pyrenophora tritici-repentis]|uniref:Large ribosomal subunit protein mL49 n=1 Tax=Pyrenophora tritici-repentis TaxID=45151 RepID=A0A2W1HY38_9PLEO|nr:Img2 domain-containing protein [Pyrenophora tritici-repentis]KAF7451624.1 Img2 domain containing protein [Pyrenophora tritici-repentis]KAF7575268.1 Img2 domain containing protein [Pyrenophora tritici-repentis]KAG9385982.1 Img2 domain containing protein [Pyrenophora tritici-repentis]KAI0587977.1 Img2 domain-containing protein [Pyrenophora tritici-repentis]